jgi:hypothetical protein
MTSEGVAPMHMTRLGLHGVKQLEHWRDSVIQLSRAVVTSVYMARLLHKSR